MNPWPVLLVLAALLAIGAVVAILLVNRDNGSPAGNGGGSGGGGGAAPHLEAVGAYDPYGTGGEHDSKAPLATDGSGSTYWETERYRSAPSLGKQGVGLVLDAGSDVQLHQLGLATSTPGFHAVIKAGESPTGPFSATVSAPQTVGGDARFDIRDGKHRYYLIWITQLGPAYNTARVNEVDAS